MFLEQASTPKCGPRFHDLRACSKLSKWHAVLALLLLSVSAGQGWGQQARRREHFLLKIGSVYEQGDFSTPNTTRVLFTPVTFRYLASRFDISATPSFALIDTSGGVRLIDGIPTLTGGGIGGIRQTMSGAGDTLIRGRIFLLDDKGPKSPLPALTPFVKVKIPTADQKLNLGTGKADYGFGVELDKQFLPLLLFGDVSYTVMGKPLGLDLRNRPGASFGIGEKVSNAVIVSALVDWRRAIFRGTEDPAELVGVITYKLSSTVSVSPNAFVGLTSGSPALGVGVELAFKFGRY